MSDRPPGLDAAAIVAAVVRPEICALAAYSVAPSEGMIKLDAMENPFPLPDAVRGRLGAALAQVAVNRYPDIAADRVKQALSRAFAIPDSLGVMLGNGSDELIQLITSALARPGAPIRRLSCTG
jgi:histidinol-phosphate aminotransferase